MKLVRLVTSEGNSSAKQIVRRCHVHAIASVRDVGSREGVLS
jgi:hypothetical protein